MWRRFGGTRHDVDHKHRELDTQEGIRACLPTAFSIYYRPVEKCREFYREKWEREQPEWFSNGFPSFKFLGSSKFQVESYYFLPQSIYIYLNHVFQCPILQILPLPTFLPR
jgi:hypothetical protein